MTQPRSADRDRVLAFRIAGHLLDQRRPAAKLHEVAALGLRNTPPGSAVLAAHARLDGLTPDVLDRELVDEKTLVEVLGPRLSPYIVPVRDAAVFMLGALPVGEESLRSVLGALLPSLDQAGTTATDALREAAAAAHAVLDRRMMTRGELSAAMTQRLPDHLTPYCRACGTRHVQESLFRLVGVAGVYVIASRREKQALYARADQWLGVPIEGDADAARAELLRRYLRCFGPSTAAHFGAWVGIAPADAKRTWNEMSDQLVPVEFQRRRLWLHGEDADLFEHPPTPRGARLLPPYDTYLDQRDRDTIVPDRELQRRVWRILGNPGAVLVDREVVGVWRQQRKGKRLVVTVEPFTALSPETCAEIEGEAARLAPIRECTSAEVTFAS